MAIASSAEKTPQLPVPAQETVGHTPSVQPGLGTVASVVADLHVAYLQSELNRVWQAEHEEADHKGATP